MKIKSMMAGMMLAAVTTATAGGILTNTNQSIDFLRNPARDAAIGLDGVYSNPAGVAFLPEGFHVGFNWQYAHQTRTIESTSPYFALGKKNNGQTTKSFEGVADAPCIPSLQAAYNTGNWSCESVVGSIANQLKPLGAQGYDMDGYMQGRQYYFGFQLGTAYKVMDNLSVYGGLRLLWGTATYKAKISNIMVNVGEDRYMAFGSFLQSAETTIDGGLSQVNAGLTQVNAGIAQYEAAGATAPEALVAQKAQLEGTKAQLEGTKQSLNALQKYSQGVNLLCNQSSVGIAPVLGADYKLGKFNFAAKYEFKTQIRMKNESTVFEASEIAAVNKFRDSEEVNEDVPAQLALGAQWSPVDDVRVNVGWHHFFDKDVEWYNNAQDLLDHDSNEYLAGVEWDINDHRTISGGVQLTRYGLSDQYMNDIKATDKLTLKAGYFQTNYEHYKRNNYPAEGFSDDFTRTNRVLGIGCQLDL